MFVGQDKILGKCNVIPHKIEVDPLLPPIRKRCYRMSPDKQRILEGILNEMLDQGIIEESVSEWAAPCLLIAKKNNSGWRFVVDYRGINQAIKLSAYPLPSAQESLENIGVNNPRYFSLLDCQSGFFQCVLDPDSKKYTAFRCHMGQFQFTTTPQGMRHSSVTYQRMMEAILRGLQYKTCLIYLDDVIIMSPSFEKHL